MPNTGIVVDRAILAKARVCIGCAAVVLVVGDQADADVRTATIGRRDHIEAAYGREYSNILIRCDRTKVAIRLEVGIAASERDPLGHADGKGRI